MTRQEALDKVEPDIDVVRKALQSALLQKLGFAEAVEEALDRNLRQRLLAFIETQVYDDEAASK